MRDLQADLDEFNHWMCDNYDTYDPALMWFIRVLPEAINRAIKAEAEVERLTDILDHYNAKCAICDCVDDVTELHAENAQLRKVVEAGEKAIKTLDNTCYLFAKADDRAIHNEAVKMFWQALAELDKEGER